MLVQYINLIIPPNCLLLSGANGPFPEEKHLHYITTSQNCLFKNFTCFHVMSAQEGLKLDCVSNVPDRPNVHNLFMYIHYTHHW